MTTPTLTPFQHRFRVYLLDRFPAAVPCAGCGLLLLGTETCPPRLGDRCPPCRAKDADAPPA